ncbi:MAG: hypothetical protein HY902_13100 [Deltaproteobacteria bacterium]|nr:hypothetical protein [Deltaproteobacteria bacterium]
MTAPLPDDRVAALHADAAKLAEYARGPAIDKALRQEIRGVLWQVHSALFPPEPEPDEVAPAPDAPDAEPAGPDLAQVGALLAQTGTLLRQLGDDRGKGARRIGDMRIAEPLPDRVMVPPSSRQTDKLAQTVQRHFRARMALTDERLGWFEQRTQQNSPTSVATVKQPEGDADRLDLELLRKEGRTKFS